MVTIKNNYHFSERQEYIDLAKDFLVDQITADDFLSGFMGIYEGINREVTQLRCIGYTEPNTPNRARST